MLQFGRNTPHTKDTILGSLGGRPVVSGNVSTALREYGVLTVSGVPGGCWAPAGPCNDRLSVGGRGVGGCYWQAIAGACSPTFWAFTGGVHVAEGGPSCLLGGGGGPPSGASDSGPWGALGPSGPGAGAPLLEGRGGPLAGGAWGLGGPYACKSGEG